MSRINTNVGSMIAQRILGQNNQTLSKSLERLSTGYRINRGADDPAGLIASENLRSEKASISAAIGNAERADQVMNIAEGGLQEINSMLLELQSLVGQSANDAGISDEEKTANQLQVDSILQTIDRIAAATSFQGTKLLNGTFDFTVSGQISQVLDYQINAAKLSHNEQRDVQVLVYTSAQHGGVFLSIDGGITTLDLSANDATFVFTIGGSKGSREFTFGSTTSLANMATQINTYKSITGISAIASGTGLVFKSELHGSDEFVSIEIDDTGGQSGTVMYLTAANETAASTLAANQDTLIDIKKQNLIYRDEGQDIGAIINGIKATAKGLTAKVNNDFLDLEIMMNSTAAQNLTSYDAFTITGGGAKFNLGPNVDILNQVSIGIENVASRYLGSYLNGYLDDLGSSKVANVEDGNLETGQKIVNNAIKQVSSLRGRLGAFQKNIVGSTIRSLGVALENTSAAESVIRDTDFASETATLTRNQILVNAATNVLSIANTRPQAVLSLLG